MHHATHRTMSPRPLRLRARQPVRDRLGTRLAQLAGVAMLAAALGGCAGTFQFSGTMRYDNLMREGQLIEIREQSRRELIARAKSYGIEPTVQGDRELEFRMSAPKWQKPTDAGPVEAEDPRVLYVRVDLGASGSPAEYRYSARLSGSEPEGFTPDARARLGTAIIAAREIFETPLNVDFATMVAPR